MLLLFLLLTATTLVDGYPEDETSSLNFCDAYVECASVALLEERLCLGNTAKRPYWLPDSHDPKKCHDKLANDYKQMEVLERDLDNQLVQCLRGFTLAVDEQKRQICSARLFKEIPKFSFGRTITYVPTNCFTGLERRQERECSTAKYCCGLFDKCEHLLTDSQTAKDLLELRLNVGQRAKDCERGKEVESLPVPINYSEDEESASWAPSGHVNVNFNDLESIEREKQQRAQQEVADKSGFINVIFHEEENTFVGNGTSDSRASRLQNSNKKNTHGDGNLGEVSNPTGGDKLSRAEFPKLGDKQTSEGSESQLTEVGGSLTIEKKKIETPRLKFPSDKTESEDVHVVDTLSQPEPSEELKRKFKNLPKNLDEHDEKFEKALKNTNEYKKLIESLKAEKTSEVANNGLSSLLNVAALAKANGIASGEMHRMQASELDDDSVETETTGVTTSPLIVVKQEETKHTQTSCTTKSVTTKTVKFEKILTLLGEDSNSTDMKEMKDLINAWNTNFRSRLSTVKDKTKSKEIEKALQDLISHFDDVSLDLIKNQANATFSPLDYPEGDAHEAGCGGEILESKDPIAEKIEKAQEKVETSELRDEHGDVVVVDDGVGKVMIQANPEISESIDEEFKPVEREENIEWHNEEYRQEIAKYRQDHNISLSGLPMRNDTTCDAYIRCRSQMHVAVDGCAWAFASTKIVSSLAESTESILFKSEELCDPDHQPLYEELYEMMIKRNGALRSCLDRRNKKFFEESICLPYTKEEQKEYDHSLVRILANRYTAPIECYRDANKIQEKCSKLRECCPYFDSCREEQMDVNLEQAILSMTARINEEKQSCIKKKARESMKQTVKGLLGRSPEETVELLRRGNYGLDIKRGAQLLRRMR